jgi:hypothetical protein
VSFDDPGKGANGETKVFAQGLADSSMTMIGSVTIRPGLGGAVLLGTIAHEGSHLSSGRAFVDTMKYDKDTGEMSYDLSKNLTVYDLEIEAFRLTHAAHVRWGKPARAYRGTVTAASWGNSRIGTKEAEMLNRRAVAMFLIPGIFAAAFPGLAETSSKTTSPFPVVKESALLSSYPRKALNAHVDGDVAVEVTVGKGKVIAAKVLSGDRLLSEETVDNIKTWTFDPTAEATFITTFSYRFEDLPSITASIRVHTELPVRVEVIAPHRIW